MEIKNYSDFEKAGQRIFGKREYKKLITWGIAMLIFFAAALTCVNAFFAPVEFHEEWNTPEGVQELVQASRAISIQGGYFLAKSWTEYPDYTKGLAAAGLISFAGACWCIVMIYKVGPEEKSYEKTEGNI